MNCLSVLVQSQPLCMAQGVAGKAKSPANFNFEAVSLRMIVHEQGVSVSFGDKA